MSALTPRECRARRVTPYRLFGWFGGHGIGGTAGFLDQIGLRPGRLHAIAAAIAETLGGLLLALGLFNQDGGYEFNLTLVAVVFALSGVGPGEWSLDNVLGIDWTGTGWALISIGAGILGGISAVIQGRAWSTSHADHSPAATA